MTIQERHRTEDELIALMGHRYSRFVHRLKDRALVAVLIKTREQRRKQYMERVENRIWVDVREGRF